MDDSLREMQWQHHSNIFYHNDTRCPMGSDCMEELGCAENPRGMWAFVDFDTFLGNIAPPQKKFNTVCISHCHNSTQVLYSTFVWHLLIFLMWCSGEHSEVLGSITSSGASNLGFTVHNKCIGCLLWVQSAGYLSGCNPASLQMNAGRDSSPPHYWI